MMMEKEKKYTVCVATGGSPYFFNGRVTDEDEEFLYFYDEKDCCIYNISWNFIVWVKEVKVLDGRGKEV